MSFLCLLTYKMQMPYQIITVRVCAPLRVTKTHPEQVYFLSNERSLVQVLQFYNVTGVPLSLFFCFIILAM